MKTISIVVPCYNEEENVGPLADALREMFRKDLPDYRYEILFIDNDSRDKTRDLSAVCAPEIRGSMVFLMPRTLDSSIPLIMECYRLRATAPS